MSVRRGAATTRVSARRLAGVLSVGLETAAPRAWIRDDQDWLVRVGVHVFRVSPVHVGEYAVRVVEPQGVTFGFTARMLVVADTGQLTVDLRSVELPKGTPMAREPAALSLLFFLTEHLVKQLFPADANEAYPPIMWRGRVAAGDAPWRGTRAEQVEALFARLTTFQRLHFDTDYSSSESKWSWAEQNNYVAPDDQFFDYRGNLSEINTRWTDLGSYVSYVETHGLTWSKAP